MAALAALAPLAVSWLLPTHAPARAPTHPRLVAPLACSAGAPTPDDLSDEALVRIVTQQTSDTETNELVWKYLGYVRDENGGWSADAVFPNWRAKYPTPPDLIGVTRTYSREVDEPVLRAVQGLQRSVPREHKDRLRPTLRPLGWSGFKLDGLTPNMTRRAQVATWLLYYRTELHGVSLDELKARKAARKAREAREGLQPGQSPATGTTAQDVV